MVARYRNNEIKPIVFPNVVVDVAKNYNNAYVLCEVNDMERSSCRYYSV